MTEKTINTPSNKPYKKKWSSLGVAFFYPNLIGYARFASLILSCYFALSRKHWIWFAITFTTSYGLDFFDGMVARMCD